MNKFKVYNFLKKLGLFILVIWTVVSLVTLLIELVPGDPALARLGDQATPAQLDAFRKRHDLDSPPFFFSFNSDQGFKWHGTNNRYLKYWKGVLTGDLGVSYDTDRPVLDMIIERYPATIKLALAALFIAILISVPLGVLAGTRKNSLIDNFASFFALMGICLPGFVLGPLLVYVFAVKIQIFNPTGSYDAKDIVLPAFTLGAALSAILTRMVRSSVIEELGEDYVRTARAKGLSENIVIYKHVLKNGLIPVVTILGLQLGVLLAGAIITEKIFNWRGIGTLLLDGINTRDHRLVQGVVLVISVTYIVANSFTDWIYGRLDPRIRIS
ncbi:MAG: ABC transporter permease [Pyrinomonadaceae bacterium]